MKTKTPNQIYEQWRRLTKYARNENNIKRVKRATALTQKKSG